MTARLFTSRAIQGFDVRLMPGQEHYAAFVTVELDDSRMSYLSFSTPAEAYALRDACQRAGDLLAEAEGTAP